MVLSYTPDIASTGTSNQCGQIPSQLTPQHTAVHVTCQEHPKDAEQAKDSDTCGAVHGLNVVTAKLVILPLSKNLKVPVIQAQLPKQLITLLCSTVLFSTFW